jgi:hypothetical protein
VSRPTPKLDVGSVASFSDIELSDSQVGDISVACGVAVDGARNSLGQALSNYRIFALGRETATPIAVAEERLDRLLTLAGELGALNALVDAPDWLLRNHLRAELDWPDKAAGRLHDVLGDYIGAVKRVREEVSEKREFQIDPPRQLARDLALIWTERLKQERTISPANGGSAFVRFVLAATDVLPSHWPWRPVGRRKYQSLGAFAKAIERALA